MNYCVGGTADGGIGADGILESGARENLRHAQIFFDHCDDAASGELREGVAARVHGGDGGVSWQRHAERFDHVGHGGGSAHGHAVAFGTAHATFGFEKFFWLHLAGANFFGHLPDAGAGTEIVALKFSVEHGAAGEANGGKITGGGAH